MEVFQTQAQSEALTTPQLIRWLNRRMGALARVLGLFGRIGNGLRFRGVYLEMEEAAAPDAPDTARARLFLQDNGAGKTQLCVRFPTGAVQVISTEP